MARHPPPVPVHKMSFIWAEAGANSSGGREEGGVFSGGKFGGQGNYAGNDDRARRGVGSLT